MNERELCAYLCDRVKWTDIKHLLNFYNDIANIALKTKEANFLHIRLKWFAEAVANLYKGQKSGYYIIDDLAEVIRKYSLDESDLLTLVTSRQVDKDYIPFNSLEELFQYAENTGGILWKMICKICEGNVKEQEASKLAGKCFAVVGIIRNYGFDIKRFHYCLIFNKEQAINNKLLVNNLVVNINLVAQEIKLIINNLSKVKISRKITRLMMINIFTKGYLSNILNNIESLEHMNPHYLKLSKKLKILLYYLLFKY